MIRMVVAVINKGIRDRVAMASVELLKQGLGDLLLLFLDLLDEVGSLVGTEGMNVVPVEVDVLKVAQLINLILADGRLILLPIRDVKGLIHHVGVNPILRGCRYTSMTLGDPSMTALNVGVGEPGARDTNGGAATGCPESIMGSSPTNAQRRALLPKVPTNPGEEFDATAKAEETHGL